MTLDIHTLSLAELEALKKEAELLARNKGKTPNESKASIDVYLNRRDNLIFLIKSKRITKKKLATDLGYPTSQEVTKVIECRNHPINGYDYMSDQMAQKIEALYNLKKGYMDQHHKEQEKAVLDYKRKLRAKIDFPLLKHEASRLKANEAIIKRTAKSHTQLEKIKRPITPRIQKRKINRAAKLCIEMEENNEKNVIRKKNIAYLIFNNFSSIDELAAKLDFTREYILHLANTVGKSYVRDELARRIEQALDLEIGYLDEEHSF
ncbi:hypothetical protein Q4100_06440 [Acinetobacter baumannii]